MKYLHRVIRTLQKNFHCTHQLLILSNIQFLLYKNDVKLKSCEMKSWLCRLIVVLVVVVVMIVVVLVVFIWLNNWFWVIWGFWWQMYRWMKERTLVVLELLSWLKIYLAFWKKIFCVSSLRVFLSKHFVFICKIPFETKKCHFAPVVLSWRFITLASRLLISC